MDRYMRAVAERFFDGKMADIRQMARRRINSKRRKLREVFSRD